MSSSLTLLLFSSLITLAFAVTTYGNPQNLNHISPPQAGMGTMSDSVLIFAENRTRRRDPFDEYRFYDGGWNISSSHYWNSVTSTAGPMLIVALLWFVLFGICLSCICCCYCCCPNEPHGYSRVTYALSLILLIIFAIASTIGCIVLYTGQAEFHNKTSNTLSYIVKQADITGENLKNVSEYLAAAKGIGVDSLVLPSEVLTSINNLENKIYTAAYTLAFKTHNRSGDIHRILDKVGIRLVVVAAVMLLLTFVGFWFSLLGLQCLVYTLAIAGWIMVAGTFIVCGVFVILHNVVTDTCVAMDEWVRYPAAHTAWDELLPCVDNATTQETLQRSKEVTYQLVNMVNVFISNVSNQDLSPDVGMPLNFNQSGPKVPILCNPFNFDYSNRQCAPGEVGSSNAITVWKEYICEVSASGECITKGRLTSDTYSQMSAVVKVSYGLYQFAPFLVDLQDCTFVRQTFTDITKDFCPGLRLFSEWVYIGLVMVSVAAMLSVIFWFIYGRERRHRYYTKQFNHPFERTPVRWQANNS